MAIDMDKLLIPKSLRLPWIDPFLRHLAKCGNLTQALSAVGKSRPALDVAYRRRPMLRDRVYNALETYCDRLEREADRRALRGVKRPIMFRGQQCKDKDGKPLWERTYSDQLLLARLRALRPHKYRDNVSLEVDNLDEVIRAELAKLAALGSTPPALAISQPALASAGHNSTQALTIPSDAHGSGENPLIEAGPPV